MPSAFAAYPAPFIREAPNGAKAQQLLWGDFVRLLEEESGDWTKARCRGTTGWLRKTELQAERLLEVNFVDIGQGDGVFLVTPDDRFMLVDAGEADNMSRFLSWRFNLRDNPARVIRIPHAVITHSDQDHYKGFAPLFASPQLRFGSVFHNGLVERAGSDVLGPRVADAGQKYVTDLISDLPALTARLRDPAFVGGKQYPKMLKSAIDAGHVEDIRAVSTENGFLPGFATGDFRIEVLGPARETAAGRPALRWFGDAGKTKNGHSVVLRLIYRDVRLLLGGDLNVPAEEYLLARHTGLDPRPSTPAEREALVSAARATFEADVAKACHHGSAAFTDLFLRAINPLATILSSGDSESYAHPRPDALGAYGKCGRGDRPLLFSTELARSPNENIKDPHKLRDDIHSLFATLAAATTAGARAAAQAKVDACLAKLERSVAVYGLINVRTDGRRVLLAQKLERPRGATREEFDVHLLAPDESGQLAYVRD